MDKEIINEYCASVSEGESAACRRIREAAVERFPDFARMISGGLENATLKLLLKISNAKNVLEVGTFVGYSALSMAEALPDDGKITTLDVNDDFVSLAKEVWAETEVGKKIELVLGPALDYMTETSQKFDMIFIDADKVNYINYFNRGLELLNEGGIIAIDNALWGGRVLEENPEEESTKTIKALNKLVSDREDLQSVLLPVRDGLHLVIKK
ncbi:O-methyltransferase [Bacteriovorax sp. DB6_IX]|uniref:O-methyltransferase n=1 Tax=Bacteriovorax sp. DB6_IX TaxID=1353530 RepID=UPI00038A30FC|nr:class I SAM-dependent methyltransferase [Bacteriovorax sp. DB6_IX]EQC51087.1 O-methyltransferase [Bacteriovorax sp. DB6_IX]